jgi:triosephosphate isomerase (TIM)
MLEGTGIGLGAQNLHWEEKGAFTGEVAPNMVKEVCGYVIIGHSERRAYFGETDETVNRKVAAAIKPDSRPFVCVGETLEQYEGGQTAEVVRRQIKAAWLGSTPRMQRRSSLPMNPSGRSGREKPPAERTPIRAPKGCSSRVERSVRRGWR